MARRRRNQGEDRLESLLKGIFGLFLLAAFAIGGLNGFIPALFSLFVLAILVLAGGTCIYFGVRLYLQRKDSIDSPISPAPTNISAGFRREPEPSIPPAPVPSWTAGKIEEALGEIDWYQFEKFCAALLRKEGYTVQRKGGAQADGGVDLVATKSDVAMLVQCKHWKTWVVQEKVIRELLGSMTHYQVKKGALYVLKGATRPAQSFAAQHDIQVDDGRALADRARNYFADGELTELLSSREHHCPRCEAKMVWRTGDFTPFWGCSTYPRCRGTLKYSGAK